MEYLFDMIIEIYLFYHVKKKPIVILQNKTIYFICIRKMGLIFSITFINYYILILQEFYADFCAIDPFHFTLNMPSNHMYMLPAVVDPPSLQNFCDRAVDGISAIFLSLKRRPVIRYQRTSDVAKRIAQETAVSISSNIFLCLFPLESARKQLPE